MLHKLYLIYLQVIEQRRKKKGMKEIWGELWIIKETMFTK